MFTLDGVGPTIRSAAGAAREVAEEAGLASKAVRSSSGARSPNLLGGRNLPEPQAPYTVLLTTLAIVLATDFAPPFLRILGPQIWPSLGMTEGEWSTLMAGRGLLLILFTLAGGVSADLWGRRRVLLTTLTAFMLCVPVLLLAPPLSVPFLSAHTLWAILGAILRTVCISVLMLTYRGRQRILAVVAFSVASGAGFLLSPLLTTLLRQSIGLRAVYLTPAALAALGIFLARKHLAESPRCPKEMHLDALGLAAWSFGLGVMVFASVLAGGAGWRNPVVWLGLALGGGLVLGARWLSGRRLRGGRKFTLRYDRYLGGLIFAGIALYLSLYAIAVQVFNFLSRVQNWPTILSGIALAPALAGALVSVLSVRLTWPFRPPGSRCSSPSSPTGC